MKAYVTTTGILFGLLAVLHVWRVFAEDMTVDPWFIVITALAAFLAGWALRLLRLMPRQ